MNGHQRDVVFAGYVIPRNTLCIICIDIFDKTKPPKVVAHENDGTFQVVCGASHPSPEDYKIVGFGHVESILPTAAALPLLRPGQEAEEVSEDDWRVRAIDESRPPQLAGI